jgi:hypothetical protein
LDGKQNKKCQQYCMFKMKVVGSDIWYVKKGGNSHLTWNYW